MTHSLIHSSPRGEEPFPARRIGYGVAARMRIYRILHPREKVFLLPRTGERALRFTGTIVARACASLDCEAPYLVHRWWLTLYYANAGKFVLSVGYRCEDETVPDHDTAYVLGDEVDAVQALRTLRPPARYAGQQELRENTVRHAWAAAVDAIIRAIEERTRDQEQALEDEVWNDLIGVPC